MSLDNEKISIKNDNTDYASGDNLKGLDFKAFFEFSPDALVIFDTKGLIIYLNNEAQRITDYEKSELINKNIFKINILKKSEIPKATMLLAKILAGVVTAPEEFNIIRKDGVVSTMEINVRLVTSNARKYILGIFHDITAKKKMAEKIKESEGLYKTLVETTPEAVTTTDLKGIMTYVSNHTLQIHGFNHKEELLGKSAIDLIAPSDRERAMENLKKTLEENMTRAEYTLLRKDGKTFTGEINAALIKDKNGKPKSFIATIRDITERKQAEDAVKESEEIYQVLFDGALDPIFVADINTGIIVNCNKAATKLVEREKSEIIGQHQKILHPPEKFGNKFTETFKKHLGIAEGQTLETQVITKSGKIRNVEIKACLIELHDKKLLHGAFRDITEQKMTEDKLKESEEKHRILYESSQDAIMTLEPPNWNFTSGNPATVRMFGAKDEKEFTSKAPYDLSPKCQPDGKLSGEKALAMINKAMKDGSNFFEWTHKRVSGEEFSATVLLAKLKIGDKEFLQATVRDITQEKKAQQEMLKRTEELERFNRLVVDRELKMVELKNKINELESKLKDK